MSTAPTVTFARSAADWHAAGTLLEDYVGWLEGNVRRPVPPAEWRALRAETADLPRHFRSPHRLAVAWIGRIPVGTLGARVTGPTAELTRFFVRPVGRGSGAASRLLEAMLDRLATDGVGDVRLHTLPDDMPAAVRLYDRFGFEVVARDPMGPGSVAMHRRLEAPAAAGAR